jgi:hypothetical protein
VFTGLHFCPVIEELPDKCSRRAAGKSQLIETLT